MGINHFVSNMYSIDELTKLVSAASERLNVSVMKYFVMLLFFVKKNTLLFAAGERLSFTQPFPVHSFSNPWKHQGVEKVCLGNKWVNKM